MILPAMTDDKRILLCGKKILVTGASGFLGSHLCRRLIEEGAEIHALSRSARPNGRGSVRWWQADTTDIATVRRIFSETKPGVIFHLAGLVTAASGLELVLPTLHSLLVSTVNVLTVAAETGCGRVVLAASLTEPIPDNIEATPSSPYAAAKWAGSAYGRMFCKLYGLPVVIVRPFMTYGPGQDNRKLIPYVTLSLLRGETPSLSSGNWEADWIYIDDVTDGLLAAAQVPAIPESTIDLGSGTLVPVRMIVQHLVDLIGPRTAPLFGALADRPLEQVRVADLRYASKTLGWRPTVLLLKGLECTVDWYRRAIKNEIVRAR
jgi:nucleoside-diphosphate-sugar epimerase